MAVADDHFGAGRVYQPYFVRVTRESCFSTQPGGEMRFDFSYLLKSLGWMGGILYLADVSWFAYSGSNIDYSLAFMIGVFIGAVISSFRRRT
ncbi:hypothetical protein [Parasutterella excrementihominis]